MKGEGGLPSLAGSSQHSAFTHTEPGGGTQPCTQGYLCSAPPAPHTGPRAVTPLHDWQVEKPGGPNPIVHKAAAVVESDCYLCLPWCWGRGDSERGIQDRLESIVVCVHLDTFSLPFRLSDSTLTTCG